MSETESAAEKDAPVLTDDERTLLDMRDRYGSIKQGYYVGFDATGVPEIDRLLAAIGWASKAYHHTEGWNDDSDWDYGPIAKGATCSDLIQRAANDAAATIERHKDALFERGERWKARTERAEDVECCASGRCEVCTPGYVWGNS